MGKLLTTDNKKAKKVAKPRGDTPVQQPEVKFADSEKAMKAYAKVSKTLNASRRYLEEN